MLMTQMLYIPTQPSSLTHVGSTPLKSKPKLHLNWNGRNCGFDHGLDSAHHFDWSEIWSVPFCFALFGRGGRWGWVCSVSRLDPLTSSGE